jgi:hypothetical protein
MMTNKTLERPDTGTANLMTAVKDIAFGLYKGFVFYLLAVPPLMLVLGFLNILLHPKIVAPLNWLFIYAYILPLRLLLGYGWDW